MVVVVVVIMDHPKIYERPDYENLDEGPLERDPGGASPFDRKNIKH